jgi:hypothetical protein
MIRHLPLGLVLVALIAIGCGGDDEPTYLPREAMLDPETCADCHAGHVDEWKSSMHAYASDDPVFLAMNARGQRETDGALGDFCVKCHAPMAVRDGLTTDGLNLAELPASAKGVTCFFCHSVASVEDDHNNPLVLADDLVMRGGFGDAIENGKHATAYSSLLDQNNPDSSTMCGACHDIVTDAGVHLERTFAEFQDTIYAKNENPQAALTCSDCHMHGSDGVVADFDGVPLRDRGLHEHTFPGVDTAAIEWPGKDDQREEIDRQLASFLASRICFNPVGNQIEVRLQNDAGHMFPSGASQDRRAWVELHAFADGTEILSSGVVPDGTAVAELDDPVLWLMRDRVTDADGDETHMFWDAASIESELLPPPSMPGADHSVLGIYPLGASPQPDRIELAVHMEPIGLEVLDDLIDSGDLDPSYRDVLPRLDLEGASLTWTADNAGADRCFP